MAKELTSFDILYGRRKDVNEMSKEELKEEVIAHRKLWDWVDDQVKWWIARTGMQVGVTRRDYKRFIGYIMGVKFDVKEIEVEVAEKVYDQNAGGYFWERKVVKLPYSSIFQMDWIFEREEYVEKKEEPLSDLEI